MMTNVATDRIMVIGVGTPIMSPMPARPANSVSSAPMQATIRVATETQAQALPK